MNPVSKTPPVDVPQPGAILLSPETDKILPKLLELERAVSHLVKDDKNPHFGSGFVSLNKTLDEVRPKALEKGLLVMQGSHAPLEGVMAVTTLFVDPESGQWAGAEAVMGLPTDAQKAMGGNTYGRRYSMFGALALGAEDDDGNTAAGADEKKKAAEKEKEKKAAKKEKDALEAARKRFYAAWAKPMALVEDGGDAKVSKALEHEFIGQATAKGAEKGNFLAITRSLSDLTAKEMSLLTTIVTENVNETAAWAMRDDTRLAAGLLVTCETEGCDTVLSPKAMKDCATIGLTSFHCADHQGDALAEQMHRKELEEVRSDHGDQPE